MCPFKLFSEETNYDRSEAVDARGWADQSPHTRQGRHRFSLFQAALSNNFIHIVHLRHIGDCQQHVWKNNKLH